MTVHQGHRKRLKARYINQGLTGFDDHNILELLLFYAIPRSDTNVLAHELIKTFGSLSNVFDAPLEELCKVKGISEHSAALITMMPQISSVYHMDKSKSINLISSTQEAGMYFLPRFYGKKNEEVHAAFLDDKKKIIKTEKLFEGTVNVSMLTTKKVVSSAVTCNATAVIIAHNHPGGVALPSRSDLVTTQNIYQALKLINVQLCDHIIVAEDDFVSLADSGEFERYK